MTVCRTSLSAHCLSFCGLISLPTSLSLTISFARFCRANSMRFVSYDFHANGTWVFEVLHFSKYGLKAMVEWRKVCACLRPV